MFLLEEMNTEIKVVGTQTNTNSIIVEFLKELNKAPPSRQDWSLYQKGSLCHHHSAAAAAAAAALANRLLRRSVPASARSGEAAEDRGHCGSLRCARTRFFFFLQEERTAKKNTKPRLSHDPTA